MGFILTGFTFLSTPMDRSPPKRFTAGHRVVIVTAYENYRQPEAVNR
jgi:hypothetical protein